MNSFRRLTAASPPTPAEWVTRHPELAPDLEEHFRDLDALGLLETRVGDYILLERLGKGGEGMVFRARHRLDGNVVALKRVLGAGMARDASPRILEEARAIACLRHPNIITIFFSGEDHDVWYYTMELMKGGSLEDHIPEYFANPPRPSRCSSRSPGACTATAAGIPPSTSSRRTSWWTTRDGPASRISAWPSVGASGMRPTSVRRPAPHATRLDAVLEHLVLPLSQIRGTVPYMSPEMASGQPLVITPAADIYGLGAILYAMLTKRPPFRGDTIAATLIKVVHDNPPSPRDLNRKVNRELQAVCLKCLHMGPGIVARAVHRIREGSEQRCGELRSRNGPPVHLPGVSGLDGEGVADEAIALGPREQLRERVRLGLGGKPNLEVDGDLDDPVALLAIGLRDDRAHACGARRLDARAPCVERQALQGAARDGGEQEVLGSPLLGQLGRRRSLHEHAAAGLQRGRVLEYLCVRRHLL